MSTTRALHERPESSAEMLAHVIAEQGIDDRMRFLMMQDFFTKCPSLPTASYYFYLSKMLRMYAPQEVKELAMKAEKGIWRPPRTADVAIVTVIPEELRAVKAALSLDLDAGEDEYSKGLRFWETSVLQEKRNEEIRVVVTMVGEARTTSCAVACSRLFRVYEVGCCLLVGIAAGVKGEIGLGDVVVSDQVLDYEGQRLDPTGTKKRPTPYVPEIRIHRDLQYFSEREAHWQKRFRDALNLLRKRKVLLPRMKTNWGPSFDGGVILAGEKLVDDGSLPAMREEYHDKVRAAEMEGSGFARACQEYGIPWLVFRGISDFGDAAGSDTRKKWKSAAALAAATAAVHFLDDAFRQAKEEKF